MRVGFFKREGTLLSAFFSEKGLTVIGQDYEPDNPFDEALNYFQFKAIAFNEEIGYRLGLYDGDFEFLCSGIKDFKKILNTCFGVAITRDFCYSDMGVTEQRLDLKPFDSLNSKDEILVCLFCDKECNEFNYETEELNDEQFCDGETFLFRLGSKLIDYLSGEVYFCKFINFDNLDDLQTIDTYFNLYDEDLMKINYLCKPYFDDNFKMWKWRVNGLNQIKRTLEKVSEYIPYHDTVGLFENVEDLGDIVEIDGDLFSKKNFAQEYILDISKRKQKEAFLEELFERIIRRS